MIAQKNKIMEAQGLVSAMRMKVDNDKIALAIKTYDLLRGVEPVNGARSAIAETAAKAANELRKEYSNSNVNMLAADVAGKLKRLADENTPFGAPGRLLDSQCLA